MHDLARKVDAFFERVAARHTADMQCSSGCSDCCHVRLTVTGIEAAALRAHVAALTATDCAALAANIAAAPADRCVALDANGRCLVYAARPIVCRSHGVPIRMTEQSLPVVESCHRNFTARGPAAADPDCILDQTTLSALVLAADRQARGDGTRIDLAKLLASAADVVH